LILANSLKEYTKMKTKPLIGIPLLMVALHEPVEVVAQAECVMQEPPPVCQNAQRININVNSRNIAPGNICIEPGDSITVNVTPNGASARIESKDGTAWLGGQGGSFNIQVPEDASGEYDYDVYFPDGSCIDPRITVGR
jgi:hypothetical protein